MLKYIFITILLLPPTVFAQSENATENAWDAATIYRDEWGVPHIYADTPRAMAFTFGYAQAEDHLEDMLLAYRVANGRAAEVYGETFIESDTHAQIMRHYDLAANAYTNIDDLTKNLCEGFSSGINSWIIDHPDEVPEWAEGVSPIDILSLLHHYQSTMAPLDYEDGYIPAKGTPIGNAWALDASRTQAGKPILVMNPHTDYDGIFQWYEAHLVTRDMNLYGATIFGLPVLLMGHNNHLGWALAPNEPDIADVYLVVDEDVPYSQESDERSLFVWENQGLEEYTLERFVTWYGPVLSFVDGMPLSYKVGGYRDFGGIRQLYDMGRSRTLEEFQQAWDKQQLSLFHLIYADRDDNIFYSYNAKVGDKSNLSEDRSTTSRLNKTDWESPIRTDRGGALWGDTLALADELPWIVNPDSGFLQASGTPPWLATNDMDWSEDDFDDWLIRDPDSYRAKRIRQLFAQGQRSFKDNQAMLYDIVVPLAAETVPYLLNAAAKNKSFVERSHPDLEGILNILRNWDYQAHTDSEAMTFFHVWWTLYSREYEEHATATESLHAMLKEDSLEVQQYLLSSASHAASLMIDYYQTIHVPWGDVHVIQRGVETVPIGGSYTGEPLFGTGDQYFYDGRWIAKQGPGFTMAVEFGTTPTSVSALPFGTSQNPDSVHYDDQLTLMQERRLKHTLFKRQDVEQHAVSAQGTLMTFRRGGSGTSIIISADDPITVTLGLATNLNVSMPEGYTAFSPFIEPVAIPVEVPIENALEFHIPQSLCTLDTLGELGVFSYTPSDGWRPVAEQEIDWDRRSFYAQGYAREVYAVLGPNDLLLSTVAQESYDDFSPDHSKLTSITQANKSSVEFLQSQFSTLSDAEQALINLAHPQSNAKKSIFPDIIHPKRKKFDGSTNNYTPFGNYHFNGIIVPSTPPGWRDFLRNQSREALLKAQERAQERNGRRLPPMQTMFNAKTSDSDSALPSPKDTPKVKSDETPPKSIPTPPKLSPEAPQDLEELVTIRPNMSRREKSEAQNPFREKEGGGLLFKAGLPEALTRSKSSNTPMRIALAPNPKIATSLIIDREFVFEFPLFGAEFALSMKKTVRAQMAFRPKPAEPYPNQLVPFTPIFDIYYDPIDASGIVSITMRVLPGVCDPQQFDQLKLYAYDPDAGWRPVPGTAVNTGHMSFVTLDFEIRNYTILGPASARLKPPKMLP